MGRGRKVREEEKTGGGKTGRIGHGHGGSPEPKSARPFFVSLIPLPVFSVPVPDFFPVFPPPRARSSCLSAYCPLISVFICGAFCSGLIFALCSLSSVLYPLSSVLCYNLLHLPRCPFFNGENVPMPSDSVAGFLDRAQASRVLFPEQIEQLIREPDIPQKDLAALCSYLLSRGVLTQFQADAIRGGRGEELCFAGYPIIDALGPCPGGTEYRALHPSLRTPLVLRKLDPGAFAPADDAAAVVERARTYGAIAHTNMLPVLDAGVFMGHPYAVLDLPPDAADLGALLKEVGGAMPGFLAAEYGWSIASVLRAIHERGGWHGEVRPGLLVVTPVNTKANPDGTLRRRPAPNAAVKLAETGTDPQAPAARADGAAGRSGRITRRAAGSAPRRGRPCVPAAGAHRRRHLRAAGRHLRAGRVAVPAAGGAPPFTSESSESLMNKIRSSEPVALTSLRPDVPAELAAFVMRMLAKKSRDRPQTAADVCEALAPFCRPGVLPTAPRRSPPPIRMRWRLSCRRRRSRQRQRRCWSCPPSQRRRTAGA